MSVDPFRLGLRGYRHMVSVLRYTGRIKERLGIAYRPDSDRRLRILPQWGNDARSPRIFDPSAVEEPLDKRTQAILSIRVESSVQKRLATGVPEAVQSRRDARPGLESRLHLDVPGSNLKVNSPWEPPGIAPTPPRRGAKTRR